MTTEGFQTFETKLVAALKVALVSQCANSSKDYQQPPLVFVLELLLATWMRTYHTIPWHYTTLITLHFTLHYVTLRYFTLHSITGMCIYVYTVYLSTAPIKRVICLKNLRQKHRNGEHRRSFAGAACATSSFLHGFIDIFAGYILACYLDIPSLDCMSDLLVLHDT